jgi:cytochrome c-type biogenesis protein CcmE
MQRFLKFGSIISMILLGLGYVAWTGLQETKSYYVTIKDMRTMGNDAYSRHLRVAGNVKPGSILRAGTSAEFVLVEGSDSLKVVYKGSEPPPDTFQDNAQALAAGDLGKDGVFYANQLQAKCASKYAPQQNGTAAQPEPKGN